MDSNGSNAALFVAQAVATTSVLGLVTGSALSFVRRVPNFGPMVGINCGVSSALFFGSREFAISPLLVGNLEWAQYMRRRGSSTSSTRSTLPPPSPTELRTNRLLDTGISGALTGAVLHSIMRGRVRISAGAFTGAIICTALQLTANELKLTRIRYLGAQEVPYSTTSAAAPLPSVTGDMLGDSSTNTPSAPTKPRSLEDHRLKVPAAQRVALDPSDPNKPRSFSERILDAMSNIVPIKKLNPEEYAVALEKQRLEEEKEKSERRRAEDGSKSS